MSFTTAQKAQIRYYLGFQDQFRDINTTLESQLDAGLSTDAETLLTAAIDASPPGILASLIDIDASLQNAHGRLKAKKIGSIDLPGRDEIDMLRDEGRRLVGRLAAMFGVAPKTDVFADGFGVSALGGMFLTG